MNKLKVVLNKEGVRELLKSEEMLSICKAHADATAAALGEGYEVSTYTGRNRVNAQITAVTREARQENMENNSILKALQ